MQVCLRKREQDGNIFRMKVRRERVSLRLSFGPKDSSYADSILLIGSFELSILMNGSKETNQWFF